MDWGHVSTVLIAMIGAVWALRSKISDSTERQIEKLADIEKALAVHVARDEQVHASQDARIARTEQGRGNGRYLHPIHDEE